MAKREYAAVYGTSRVPTWFKQEQDVASARRSNRTASFDGVVNVLTDEYGATKRSCYYEDEAQGGKFEVPHRRVLINPAWEGEDALDDAPQNHAAWTTVSDEYAPVDADDALGIIPAVASDFGYDDLYGVVDAYRNGGEVVAEIVLDDLRVEYEDTEYVLGFEAGYDHYGSTSVWARLLAYNTETGACLRHLSDRMTCRHRGEDIVERVRPWYENLLEKAERLGDRMYEVVAEADAHEIDIRALPFDMQTWFSAPGYPDSYAEDAAARLPDIEARDEGDDFPYEVYVGSSDETNDIRVSMPVAEDELGELVCTALNLLASNVDDERKAEAAENALDMFMYGEVDFGEIHGATTYGVDEEGEAEIQITAGSSKVRARIPDDEIGDALARKIEQARDELEGYDAGDL